MNVGYVDPYTTESGKRYRVRWTDANAKRLSKSFRLKRDADAFLRQIESDRMRGIVADPRGSNETVRDYAQRWLDMRRASLAPRTVELYRSQLNRWILPAFGEVRLGKVMSEAVREWHGSVGAKASPITAAKCYRLLRTMLSTAEEDGLIPRNPCRIKGGGHERSGERPLLTATKVHELAETIEPRYRALVLLAAYGGLRRGELLALQRRHVDELHCTITVEGQLQQVTGRGRVILPTKSDAGRRVVTIPSAVMREIVEHAGVYSDGRPDAWLFTAEKGGPAREHDLNRAWRAAAAECGAPDAHMHDLRHFSGTTAAQAGATVRELQARLGHSTARAAMIYQHAAADRDRELAERMGGHFERGSQALNGRRSGAVVDLRAH